MARQRPHLRVLRRTVDVVCSTRSPNSCWHLTPACGGLDRVPEDMLEPINYPDIDTLLADETIGRPCRMCALEAVLRTVLQPARVRDRRRGLRFGPTQTVTFTSLPATNVDRRQSTPTPSGQARVRRLARSLGLATTELPGTGVIASGTVARRGVPVLLNNLHGCVLDGGPADAVTLECFWTLVGDLRKRGDDTTDRELLTELWTSARLLTR